MKSKKNRFFNFCLAFVPGCAEMYMGFMKMGLSLMVLFWGILGGATMLHIGPLLYVDIIVWIYSFFHARNMVHMPEDAFMEMEDDYLFHLSGISEKDYRLMQGYRKIAAVILIFLGAVLCLEALQHILESFMPRFIMGFFDAVSGYLPRIIVGGGIIAVGVWMIRGKKQELLEDFENREDGDWYEDR